MDSTKPKSRGLIVTAPTPMSLLKVIPDRSVKNTGNKLLWRLLHDLLSLDHKLKSRMTKEHRFRYHRQEKDRIWIEMVFRSVEGIRTIEYYLAVPSKMIRTFCQKVTDKFPQVTLEEVELDCIEVPEEAELTEFRYQRHDLFSLRCNDAEQNIPISAFMETTYDLQDNDFARLSFAMERMDRKKWLALAKYGHEQLAKKKVPPRARADFGAIRRQFGGAVNQVAQEAKTLGVDVLQGVNQAFFGGKAMAPPTITAYTDPEYEQVMIDGKLSNDTKEKLFEPTFKTKIRLAVVCNDRSRRHMIKQSIQNAFAEMTKDNTLVAHKIKSRPKVIEELNTLQNVIHDRDANIMSCKEIGKFGEYPTAQLQLKHADILESKRNVEIEVPKVLRDPTGILLGYSDYHGNKEPVYLPVPKFNNLRGMDEFMMSRAFIGSPRMGKDTALANFIADAVKKGCSAVVLDVVCEEGNTRGLADSIRDALPPEKVIDWNLENVEFPIALGITEMKDVGNFLASEFVDMYELNDVEQTRMYMREAIKACNGDVFQARLLFMSGSETGSVLDKKVKQLKTEGKDYAAAFWEAFQKDSQGIRSFIRKPILNRLDDMFGDDILKNIFGQKPNPETNFIPHMKEGKAIIIRAPIRPPITANSVKMLCRWIILKTFLAKQVMQDKECPTFLVLNEPHQFLTAGLKDMLERMLRECPKLRLSLIFAFHDFSKSALPKELVEVLLSASINWHIFKNSNMEVYSKLRKYLEPTYTPDDAFDQTQQYHSINSFFIGGSYIEPFMMKTLPPINERIKPFNNRHLTQQHSKKYGRPRKDVEKEIFEQEKVLFVKK